jgi:predicted nucleic acid-binding protein
VAHFVDSNMVCYCFSVDQKNQAALSVVRDATISVQVLNEFANVARRKWKYSWAEVTDAVALIRTYVAQVRSVDEATHGLGRALAERYKLNIYDGFIVAAAVIAECDTLYSEDMQHGLVIEGRLTIRNPFIAA